MQHKITLTASRRKVILNRVDRRPLSGLAPVDPSRCRPKRNGQSGIDFMTANGEGGGQALQVMTQRFLGGHLFGVDCSFGGGQSEHVAFVMPDTGRLFFFEGGGFWFCGPGHCYI